MTCYQEGLAIQSTTTLSDDFSSSPSSDHLQTIRNIYLSFFRDVIRHNSSEDRNEIPPRRQRVGNIPKSTPQLVLTSHDLMPQSVSAHDWESEGQLAFDIPHGLDCLDDITRGSFTFGSPFGSSYSDSSVTLAGSPSPDSGRLRSSKQRLSDDGNTKLLYLLASKSPLDNFVPFTRVSSRNLAPLEDRTTKDHTKPPNSSSPTHTTDSRKSFPPFLHSYSHTRTDSSSPPSQIYRTTSTPRPERPKRDPGDGLALGNIAATDPARDLFAGLPWLEAGPFDYAGSLAYAGGAYRVAPQFRFEHPRVKRGIVRQLVEKVFSVASGTGGACLERKQRRKMVQTSPARDASEDSESESDWLWWNIDSPPMSPTFPHTP